MQKHEGLTYPPQFEVAVLPSSVDIILQILLRSYNLCKDSLFPLFCQEFDPKPDAKWKKACTEVEKKYKSNIAKLKTHAYKPASMEQFIANLATHYFEWKSSGGDAFGFEKPSFDVLPDAD
jgi:hypothetical protein